MIKPDRQYIHNRIACLLLIVGISVGLDLQSAEPAKDKTATSHLEQWRNDAQHIRIMSSNDVPQAYEEAQKLLDNLPQEATIPDQILALNLLARTENNYALTEQAKSHARQALELAKQYDDTVGQVEAWILLGYISINLADVELIKEAPEQAMLALEEVHDRPDLLGEAMLLMTSMYLRFDKLEEAVANALQAVEMAKQENNPSMLANAYRGLAIVFQQQHRHEEALEYFTRMREYARTISSRVMEAYALHGIAAAMLLTGNLAESEKLSRLALVLFREAGGPFYLSHGLSGLASFLHLQGRDAEAVPLMKEVLAIQKQHNNKLGVWWALFNLSTYNLALNKLELALADAERARALAEEIGLSLYRDKSVHRIAEIYSAKGDYKQAYEFASKDIKIKEQAEQIHSSKRLLELTQRYREESKQRKIDALEQQTRLQKAELRQREIRHQWLLIVLVISIVAFFVMAWLLLRLRQSHRLLKEFNLNLQQSRNELRKQTNILQSVLDNMGEGIAVTNERGEFILLNPVAEKIIGTTRTLEGARIRSEQYGLYLPDQTTLYPADDLPLSRAIQGESCDGVEIYARNSFIPEGCWLSVTARPLTDKGGITRGGVAVFSDITNRKQAQKQMELTAKVFEQSAEGIFICDTEKNILSVNRAFCEISGYSENELFGKSLDILEVQNNEHEYEHETWNYIWQQVDRNDYWQGEIRNRQKNGDTIPVFMSISTVLDERNNIINYIGISSDITQHKQAEARIHRLAYFDSLTELPNRILLNDRIEQAINHAQRENKTIALMFLDLDRFKNINDSLGHRIGDAMLVEIAKRLTAIKRGEDTVSRLGGDEFILLLPATDSDGAAHVAKKIIQSIAKPFQIDNYALTITPSIGISMYPIDGDNADVLIQNADSAMYRAKEDGRSTFRFFTPEMYVQANRILQLENALHYALERHELELYYQPQVNISTGNIIGCEALLRWKHPQFGMISPAEFIPIAEDSGQILAIGEWVLKTAVAQIKNWAQSGSPILSVSVNLSVVQFRQVNLVEIIKQALEENQVAPEYLELELTERITMEDPVTAINIMNRLRQIGIKFSIDDFGTGYSSLSYLKRFNIHKLKIDQSFVRDITVDPEDEEIVKTIINLAKSLNLHIIAEGVETREQLEILKIEGCNEIQGYYFSKPIPAPEFEKLLKSWSRNEKKGMFSA